MILDSTAESDDVPLSHVAPFLVHVSNLKAGPFIHDGTIRQVVDADIFVYSR